MKSILSSNKKGSMYDPITMGIFLVLVSITIFIAFYIWGGFSNAMEIASTGSPGEEVLQATLTNLTGAYSSIDYMIPIIVVGFMIISLILAFKTGSNIIYAFLSFVVWGFAVLISLVYKDVFELFAVNFPSVSASFPILVFIMSNIKWVVLSWIFLISLVMFTRNKQEDTSLNAGISQIYG